jgi:hypothetical protein
MVCHTVGLPHFQTTAQSQKVLEDHLLAVEVKAALIDMKPDVDVTASDGRVLVDTTAPLSQERRLAKELEKLSKIIPGIKEIHINVHR